MSQLYSESGYTIDVPDGWEFVERASSVALFRCYRGKGAINVSKMEAPDTETNPLELIGVFSEGYAGHRPIDAWQSGVEVAFGDCERDGRHWRYWVLWRRPIAVFLSYNCKVENISQDEIGEVEQIVHSTRLR